MKRFFLLVICIVYAAGSLLAQGVLASADLRNVDIDKLSDTDIKTYFQKAQESGLTETQLFELAKTRGLDDMQAQKLKDRMALLGLKWDAAKTGTLPAENENDPAKKEEAYRKFDEKLGKVEMLPQSFNKRIFGAELFGSNSTTFEPNLRIATPSHYVVGPDDELIINVFGYSEKTYRQRVTPEGNIYIENVGLITVAGLTIEEAETKIKARLTATIYKAMASGATKMKLSLGNIRSMRITIIGEAKKPGTYTVSSLTTLFNALYLCGGPSDNGSYRNIELVRGNKVVRKIDLYRFLTAGDRSDNILLQEMDVIRIPYYEARMVFDGYVKRPGIYEIAQGETFDRLFGYAGKFADSAYRKAVTIYQINEERLSLKTLTADEFAQYQPRMADSVVVTTATMRFANRVNIKGAVQRPGDYELKEGMDIAQLIRMAGGFREDAYMEAANVLRLGEDLQQENVSFSPRNVMRGEERFLLKREDAVMVSSIFELQDKYTVTVDGEVSRPGPFVWRKDLRLRDLILIAGGIKEAASAGGEVHIEVSRRVRKADVTGVDFKQSEIIKVLTTKTLDTKEALMVLEPFDMIVVRQQPGYQEQRSVYIQGPVMFPGRYFLEKSGERISDLLRRAGGFQAVADSNAVFIRRFKTDGLDMEQRKLLIGKLTNISPDSIAKSPKLQQEFEKAYSSLSVNLTKVLATPGSNDDLILENGDVISVSQSSSLVKVSGEVYFPTMIPYEPGTNLKYYVKRTGDFTAQARRSQAFVIYPDGKAEGVKRFLFFKSYPKIVPRSEIFVPGKGEQRKGGLGTAELIALSSILATLGTLIISIVR